MHFFEEQIDSFIDRLSNAGETNWYKINKCSNLSKTIHDLNCHVAGTLIMDKLSVRTIVLVSTRAPDIANPLIC